MDMQLIADFLLGNPLNNGSVVLAWIWWVIILIIAIVAAYALQPKPAQPAPATLEDFDFPVAEDGKPAGVAFGDVWFSDPNVLWYGDLRTKPIKESSK